MRKSLYLILAAVLIITAIGVVKILTLSRQDLIDIKDKNGLVLASGGESISAPRDRLKSIIQPKAGDDDFITNLPCFRCHQMEDWEGAEDSEGFPHSSHLAMEVHCLDCHSFVAHGKGMNVAFESCEKCH